MRLWVGRETEKNENKQRREMEWSVDTVGHRARNTDSRKRTIIYRR